MDSATDWVGAIGTAGALLAAVYTLWRQVQADVRAQAQKVGITFDPNPANPQAAWSVENHGKFPVELYEIRAIFHHGRSLIGAAVRPRQDDGWHFIRSSGWRTTLTRALALVCGRPLEPVNYPDARETRGSWTTLTREGITLKPNEPLGFPLPEYDPDVGMVIRARFTDSAGRNWWRIWPTGELKSVWDPDFWSVRRKAYIFRTLYILLLALSAVAVSTTIIPGPAWSIAISWVSFAIVSYAAWRVFQYSRKFPIEFWGLEPLTKETNYLPVDGKRIAYEVSVHSFRHDCVVMPPGPASAESVARRHDDALGYRSVVEAKRVGTEGPGQRGAGIMAGCR